MRYVIVCVVKGETGDFNNEMRKDIFQKFKAKSSKLPAHFTIKAPFEYDKSITDLEEAISEFCKNEEKAEFSMNRYNHFDNRVIYMDVDMSRKGKILHNKLIDVLNDFDYIEFNKKDGKDKVFHVTLTSKKVPEIYDKVWEYVNKFPFNFNCYFDNVSIYKWEDNTWKLHKEFIMKNHINN